MTPEQLDSILMPLIVANIDEETGTPLFMPVWTAFLDKYEIREKDETVAQKINRITTEQMRGR